MTAVPAAAPADRDAVPRSARPARDHRADARRRGCRPADRRRRRPARRRRGHRLDPRRPGRQRVHRPGGELRGGHRGPQPIRTVAAAIGEQAGRAEPRLVGVRDRGARRLRGGARRRSRPPAWTASSSASAGRMRTTPALKLARTLTGRREVIAFSGGYFGRAQRRDRAQRQGRVRAPVGRDADAHFFPYP